MYEKSLEKPYSWELFSIQDTVQDMCDSKFLIKTFIDWLRSFVISIIIISEFNGLGIMHVPVPLLRPMSDWRLGRSRKCNDWRGLEANFRP